MRDVHIEKIMGKSLGTAILEYRERKKLTQVALANKLGRKRGNVVSDIEHGEKKVTGQDLVRICKELEVPLLDVVDLAFLLFRKEMARLGGENGGFLLGAPSVTREDIENGFVSLTGSANEWMSKYLRFAYPPNEMEMLRYNVQKTSKEDDSFSAGEVDPNGSRRDEEDEE